MRNTDNVTTRAELWSMLGPALIAIASYIRRFVANFANYWFKHRIFLHRNLFSRWLICGDCLGPWSSQCIHSLLIVRKLTSELHFESRILSCLWWFTHFVNVLISRWEKLGYEWPIPVRTASCGVIVVAKQWWNCSWHCMEWLQLSSSDGLSFYKQKWGMTKPDPHVSL